jgi:hypothetical protein
MQQKGHYLYADNSGKLRSSGDQPIQCAGHFKFTKSLDGSVFIYSMAKVIQQIMKIWAVFIGIYKSGDFDEFF